MFPTTGGATGFRCEPGRAAVDRWRTAARVLDAVRRTPGLTRVALAEQLRLSSATTTETVARLRTAGWVAEERAPVSGRGRPTTSLVPAADGPRVLALDLRHEDWRLGVAGLDGVPTVVASGRRVRACPEEVGAAVAERGAVGLAVSFPAPLSDGHVVRSGELDWTTLDLARLTGGSTLRVVQGNDATLAGLAEARSGAAAGAGTALTVLVEVGLGGTLLIDGRPQTGAHGAAGEFGHLPFGDPAVECACGARGCWGPEVDGYGLARRLGAPAPADPRTFATTVLDRSDAPAVAAVAGASAALGRGLAGLVNAHDPDVVVLGGLAPRLRGAAFEEAYAAGLMGWRRAEPTPVRDAVHGADAALHGAVALALDEVTSAEGLARLAADESEQRTPAGPAARLDALDTEVRRGRRARSHEEVDRDRTG
ncbi:ROK family transcriptional regulator [Actinomycetospora corticicola]|uniref:Putative NBD/HSP70 family sugar kinase n=1 Tax=Actinomycetospora corticicola TaxID=663602 RepID=A0A7Y9J6E7_9PSEU|nr:ROK family transcriptional regulator [Actinomycetospora corticicola]NYD36429.1 putative NBD/HSP70 family sugar kinase [Actinomycetospora corticicola]